MPQSCKAVVVCVSVCVCVRLQASGSTRRPIREALTSARPPGAAPTTSKRYSHRSAARLGLETTPGHSQLKDVFLSFLRFFGFTQNVFYLSGSEVSLNILLLKVGFHCCLSGGQAVDHMQLLGLQVSRPQAKFNLLSPLVPHSAAPRISLEPVVFERR